MRPLIENIDWIFFDIGSTLVNEEASLLHRLRDIARASGRPFEEVRQLAVSLYRQNLRGDRAAAETLGVPTTPWHTEDECLYPDALPCLMALRGKAHIGVIANQPLGSEARLKTYGLTEYIELLIASAEEGVAKPDLKIYELALERSGCAAGRALMVGDRVDNDIIPAKAVGMKTVWVRRGYGQYWQPTGEAQQPDHTISTLVELPGLLK